MSSCNSCVSRLKHTILIMIITGRPQEDVTLAGCRNGHVMKGHVWQLSSYRYEWCLILWQRDMFFTVEANRCFLRCSTLHSRPSLLIVLNDHNRTDTRWICLLVRLRNSRLSNRSMILTWRSCQASDEKHDNALQGDWFLILFSSLL